MLQTVHLRAQPTIPPISWYREKGEEGRQTGQADEVSYARQTHTKVQDLKTIKRHKEVKDRKAGQDNSL